MKGDELSNANEDDILREVVAWNGECDDMIEEANVIQEEFEEDLGIVKAFLADGEIDSAQQILRGLLEKFPNSTIVNYYMAIIHCKQKEYIEGAPYLKKILELQPDNEFCKKSLARIERSLARKKKKRREKNKVIEREESRDENKVIEKEKSRDKNKVI